MKIKISRSEFQNALSVVKDCVIGNPDIQILSNVKIEASGSDRLTLTTTNLNQTVSTSVKCNVVEQGSTTVPVKVIAPMVGALTSETVEFSHDGGAVSKAVLTGGDVVYKISAIKAGDFPVEASVDGKKIVFSQAELKDLFRKSVYASSVDTMRRVLVSVCMQSSNGKVFAVGTDGRRLACATVEKDVEDGIDVVIPTQSIRYLQRLMSGNGNVNVTLDRGKAARFESDDWTLQTKLVDDAYPRWRAVIPTKTCYRMKIDREDMKEAVNQVALSSSRENTNIAINIKGNVLTLTASSHDVSDAKTMIEVDYDGEEVDAMFNPHYILDVLGSLDDDEIEINLIDGKSPVTFTSGSSDNVAVVMPLRVS